MFGVFFFFFRGSPTTFQWGRDLAKEKKIQIFMAEYAFAGARSSTPAVPRLGPLYLTVCDRDGTVDQGLDSRIFVHRWCYVMKFR